MILGYLFIVGTIIGSFLNVVVYRSVHTEGNKRKRSYCPSCSHTLGVLDLIPLLSFIFLSGKCRYCRHPISATYFAGELVGGMLFVLCGLAATTPLQLVYYVGVVSVLQALFFTDLYYGILPNKLILTGVAFTVIFFLLHAYGGDFSDFLGSLLSGMGAFAFFFALHYFSGGKAMGAGDVKYVFWMGLLLGWPNILVGLFLAFLTGAAISVTLIVLGSKKLGQTIPFGPFLVFGTIVALFWGHILLNWYLGFTAQ